MDIYIKATIDARKNLIFNHCKNGKVRKITDVLFKKIEHLGENCKDVEEFENKFLESKLCKRYKYIYEKTNKSL
ncbi:hypothetical protein [Anaerofustis sp.]|uniref:hypothetical protein n=1 Tax=Anaerofustis sp. TaxID=1872517 RepID=UPI0025BDE86F|nr:hypothetical protein [Anaerofustis sp.]